MSTNKAVKLGLGAVLVTLLVTSGPVRAEGDLTPLSDGKPAPSWKIHRHVDRDVIELVTGNSSGSLSTLCSDAACGVFFEPQAGCVPGARYPVLINSSKRVGVVPTWCTMIPKAVRADGVRYVVMFREQNAMFQAMLEEMDLTIAFPTQGGEMNVISVAMTGVRDMLASVLPRLPEIAGNMGARPRPHARPNAAPIDELDWTEPGNGRVDGYEFDSALSVSWRH